jgi:hypothetical protein
MQWRSHAIAPSQVCGKLVDVSTGEELLEERRRRRRAGDPRLTEADREILGRVVDGDLADEFQAALDAVSAADPLLGDTGNLDELD